MQKPIDIPDELGKLYHLAIRTGDYDYIDLENIQAGLSHQVEFSPWVFDQLRRTEYWFQATRNSSFCAVPLFWEMFQVKFIQEPMPEGPIGPADAAPPTLMDDSPPFIHLALRLERRNGRFQYFDFAGNLEEMT